MDSLDFAINEVQFGGSLLKPVASNQPHLMESNQFTRLGAVRNAILVSGQHCNADDGLIWPTHAEHVSDMTGRFVVLAGRR